MEQDPLGCLKRVEAGETLTVVRGKQAVAEIKPAARAPQRPLPNEQSHEPTSKRGQTTVPKPRTPLPYGQPPDLTAPEDISKGASKRRWKKMLGELAAQEIWVELKPVCEYLDDFPDVADPLIAIARNTREKFGPETTLTLEINRDPEIDDKYLKLLVSLPTYSPEAIERIDAISAAHEEQLWDKKGHILVVPHYLPLH